MAKKDQNVSEETTVVVCVHCGSFRESTEGRAEICTNNGQHSPSVMGPADPDKKTKE